MNAIHSAHGGVRRGRIVLLIALIAAYLGWCCMALAGTVYEVSGAGAGQNTPVGGASNANLDAAIDDLNQRVSQDSDTVNPNNVILNINQDYSTAGTAGLIPQWFLTGHDETATPGNYISGSAGFNNVTVSGSGATGGRATLEITGTNTSPVFGVINAAGAVDINNLNLKGGYIDVSGLPVNVGGAGLYVGASNNFHEAGNNGVPFTTFKLTNVDIDSNHTYSINSGAMGGGLFVSGLSGGNPNGTVEFSNVVLKNNRAEMQEVGASTSSAIGGGGRIVQVGGFTWDGGEVSNNQAIAFNASHAHAGGFAYDADSNATITNVKFFGNTADISGLSGNPQGWARGGGFYAYSPNQVRTVTLGLGTTFTRNEANAADNNNSSMGGGAYFQGLVRGVIVGDGTTKTFDRNRASTVGGTAMGGAVASWHQGVFGNASLTLTNAVLDGNTAEATGIGNAQGGGVHSFNTTTITGGKYVNNKAITTTGAAAGGALYTQDRATAVSVSGSSFTGNQAYGAIARGGAIFQDVGTLSLTNVSLTGNSAVGGSLAAAQGGAVFMNTDSATNATTLNLVAGNGKQSVISGNTASNGTTSRSDGIHFGSVSGASNANAAFNVTASGTGVVSIQDAVTVDMNNNRNFAMRKAGTGTLNWQADNTFTTAGGTNSFTFADGVSNWRGNNRFAGGASTVSMTGGTLNWNGTNTFATAGGNSRINLTGGVANLGANFTANASGGNLNSFVVTTGKDARVNFASARYEAANANNAAIFNFSGAGAAANKNMNVAKGTVLSTDLGREVLSFDRTYLVAQGLSTAAAAQTAAANFTAGENIMNVFAQGTNVYANAHYFGGYERYYNPNSARFAIDQLAKATDAAGNYVYDSHQVAAIRDNARASTAELFMDHGFAFMNNVTKFAENAINVGVRTPFHNQTFDPYGGRYTARRNGRRGEEALESRAFGEGGFRLWAGYYGDFRRQDGHGGMNGYRSNSNGFVIGLNYDFSQAVSAGFYGGYTYSKSKAREIDSQVKGDNGHFGLVGRFSPLVSLPTLAFFADIGYHFSDNDFYRRLGGYSADGSFDQDIWTVALGVENKLTFGNFTVTPGASMRWMHVDQDDLNESGLTRTHTEGFSKHAWTSRLGVDAGYSFVLPTAIITPKFGLGWRYNIKHRSYGADTYYLDVQNPVHFRTRSNSHDRNSLDIDFAVNTVLKTGSSTQVGLDVGYQLNLGRHSDNHTVYAGVSVGF